MDFCCVQLCVFSSHKFIDLIKYVKNSRLSYWDQVMVVNSLVDDIFSLYPNDNIYNMPRYFGTQNSLKEYSFLKMWPLFYSSTSYILII